MTRVSQIALFIVLLAVPTSRAWDGDCCGHCGCKMHCQVMCEWASCKVLRYKVVDKECPPPCCECCDDRWILGCCKPIRVINLQPHLETKKYLVRQYIVKTCVSCGQKHSAPLPLNAPTDDPPMPPKTTSQPTADHHPVHWQPAIDPTPPKK